jgi:hypothetical protein
MRSGNSSTLASNPEASASATMAPGRGTETRTSIAAHSTSRDGRCHRGSRVVEVEHHLAARNKDPVELAEEPKDLVRIEMLHDTVREHRVRAISRDHRGLGTRDPVNLVIVVTPEVLVDPSSTTRAPRAKGRNRPRARDRGGQCPTHGRRCRSGRRRCPRLRDPASELLFPTGQSFGDKRVGRLGRTSCCAQRSSVAASRSECARRWARPRA